MPPIYLPYPLWTTRPIHNPIKVNWFTPLYPQVLPPSTILPILACFTHPFQPYLWCHPTTATNNTMPSSERGMTLQTDIVIPQLPPIPCPPTEPNMTLQTHSQYFGPAPAALTCHRFFIAPRIEDQGEWTPPWLLERVLFSKTAPLVHPTPLLEFLR